MNATPLEYLFSLEHFGIKFGLENVGAILEALGHPENAFRSVHIAGTNGKGSVTAMIDTALRAAGHKSGRYTSPHLVHLTERFVVDGQQTTQDELSQAVDRVRTVIVDLQRRGVLDVHPTFFEVTTAAAFEIFRNASVEVAVCEVGLGGRLDATNVLSPMVTAITSIALDHQQYLGTSIAEIAGEKAGIIKHGVPVVVGPLAGDAEHVIRRVAQEREAPFIRADEGVAVDALPPPSAGGQAFRLRTPRTDYGAVNLRLEGRHQIDNAVIAVRVLECLDENGLAVSPDAIVEGLARVRWPGRLEHVELAGGRSALLDAAHNPAGAEALARFLAQRGVRQPLVFAAMRDKDARGILTALLPYTSSLVLTRATTARSADPQTLLEIALALAPDAPVYTEDSVRTALSHAWKLSPDIVVAGSIFLLGDVLQELERT
ncbi:MAG TPA: folylpolyglutamate synthase/dihydrofolate synthase family protein [Vicinamibacterales bacterium]